MRELIGLKIVAIKGSNYTYEGYPRKQVKKKYIEPEYIFFDDGETYIQLDEQDYYSYHDCSASARHLNIYKNKEYYDNVFNSSDISDSNTNL